MFTLKEYIYDFDKLLDEQDERSPGNTVHEIVHLSATVHTAVYLLVLFSEKGVFLALFLVTMRVGEGNDEV